MARFDVVFEGGGAKGSVFVGALEELTRQGHTTERLVGTSAGAITAALLAAGYTPAEMLEAANERVVNTDGSLGKPRFATFLDQPQENEFSEEVRDASATLEMFRNVDLPFIPNAFEDTIDKQILSTLLKNPRYRQVFSLVECGGLFSGVAFLRWLQQKLSAKGIPADCTLAGFFERTGRDLSLVITDTTAGEMLVLNHRTAPACPLAWAVRMSMSIPFVWREVVWQEGWGDYRGQTLTGHIIVDGGACSNFPLHLVAVRDETTEPIMGKADPNRSLNLGLLIDEELDVPGAPGDGKPPRQHHSLRMATRITRLVDTMSGARDKETIRVRAAEICRLPAKGYGTTEFDMSPERMAALVEAGRETMREYLRGRRFPDQATGAAAASTMTVTVPVDGP